MGIQGLVATGVDNAPPKPKEIQKMEQKSMSSVEKTDENHYKNLSESSMKKLTDAIAESNKIDMSMARISFSKDDDTGDILIKIIDNKTDEVIKQIPPEEIVELRKRLGDMSGLMLDRKV